MQNLSYPSQARMIDRALLSRWAPFSFNHPNFTPPYLSELFGFYNHQCHLSLSLIQLTPNNKTTTTLLNNHNNNNNNNHTITFTCLTLPNYYTIAATERQMSSL